jgi:hypothetical protein
LVWRFCLRVFAGIFSLLLFPPLSLVVISRPPSSPPLDSSDSGLTRCLWQEAPLHDSVAGVSYVGSHRSPRSLLVNPQQTIAPAQQRGAPHISRAGSAADGRGGAVSRPSISRTDLRNRIKVAGYQRREWIRSKRKAPKPRKSR